MAALSTIFEEGFKGRESVGLSHRALGIFIHQAGDRMRGYITQDSVNANELHVAD